MTTAALATQRERIAAACERIAAEHVRDSDCHRVAMACARAARRAP